MTAKFVRAGTLADLDAKGRLVVRGSHRPILIVSDQGRVYAFDNRCPHMGFPLDRGSVEDGILTCHWHHARFDLASGCTFDLCADDVPTCQVELRGEEVWVKPGFGHSEPAAYWRQRLEVGMAHNLGLTIAKAIQGQLVAGVAPLEILRQAALFGVTNLNGWGSGMTVLTALGNLLPILSEEETFLALFHGIRRLAADCDGAAPHRRRSALAGRPGRRPLKRWLPRWAAVRHEDAAERTILTAISDGAQPAALADLLLAAETDRTYADSGHSLDFVNKAFESLDLLDWRHAAEVLPLVVGQMAAARGAEESTEWRQPVDLIALCERAANELPTLFTAGRDRGPWLKHAELAHHLLGDDPSAIIVALKTAISDGADFADLGRSLCYAAALRLARFGTANEHGDWETAHHVFTYCNAVHQGLKRIGAEPDLAAHSAESARGVLHGAMAIYLIRYLNVPPARLPGEGDDRFKDLPSTVEGIRSALLDAFDRQHRVDEAARLLARHFTLRHPPESIICHAGACALARRRGLSHLLDL